MNERDLQRIESKLGCQLRNDYRDLMLRRSCELSALAETFAGFADSVFLDPKRVIRENMTGRDATDGMADAFPRWWERYFLVGTNGAGDFYCLRHKGDRRVWMIGSDCGNRAQLQANSFTEFVDRCIARYRDPPQLPSSFDGSVSMLQRFSITLWEDAFWIAASAGDRPLTPDRIESHGIAVTTLKQCLREIAGALASRSAKSIRINPEIGADEDGRLMMIYETPKMKDPRVAAGTLDLFCGRINVRFSLPEPWGEEHPEPGDVKTDWDSLHDALVRLLRLLHPAGTEVSIGPAEVVGGAGPYQWSFQMKYEIPERKRSQRSRR